MSKRIILFELNEVPFRIIDQFCRWHPESGFATRLDEFQQFETVTQEVGYLSPWRTWPSVHRGVNDAKHFIYDFGQDLTDVDKAFPPVWRLLAQAGISTGVCGSLHTYPLPKDLDNYAFYLPDTFAAGSECFPNKLDVFQRFNLTMARESGRNVSRHIPWKESLSLLANAPELGFKLSTALDVGMQLLSERQKNWLKVRRRTYQVVLAFDVFMKQLQDTRPQFCSFFTNHVASSLHRFWAAAFPDEYQEFGFDDAWVETYSKEIDFTMQKFDGFFRRLMAFVDANPEFALWVTTSMGQAATKAQPLETQLYVKDLTKFMAAMGFEKDEWSRMPAMLPQVNVRLVETRAAAYRDALENLVIDGWPVQFRQADHGFFSIDLGHCNLHEKPQFCQYRGKTVSYESMSLENVEIEDKSNTTAYHIPQGCLLVYDPLRPKRGKDAPKSPATRTKISTLDIAPTILKNYSVPIPDYMQKPIPLEV